MNGLTKNFDMTDSSAKDKLVQDYIKTVNPYRTKPSLNIDVRSLEKHAKENHQSIINLAESEIQKFKMK